MRKENTPRQFIPLISLGSTRPQVSGAGTTVPVLQRRKLRYREVKYLVKLVTLY